MEMLDDVLFPVPSLLPQTNRPLLPPPIHHHRNTLRSASVVHVLPLQESRPRRPKARTVFQWLDDEHVFRAGTLTVLCAGSFGEMNNQTQHTANALYPNGYKSIRIYWSRQDATVRCCYYNEIVVVKNKLLFCITPSDENGVTYVGASPEEVLCRCMGYRRNNNDDEEEEEAAAAAAAAFFATGLAALASALDLAKAS